MVEDLTGRGIIIVEVPKGGILKFEVLETRFFSKFWTRLVSLIFLVSLVLTLSPLVFGATLPDLQKQKKQTQEQIEEQERQAEQKKKEAQTLAQIISGLDRDISNTEAKIAQTQNQIEKTASEIDQTTQEITQKEEELRIQQENLKEALVAMYELSNKTLWEQLLGFQTLSELITHNEYIDTLELKIEQTIAEIERLKSELEQKKKDLESKKAGLQQLKRQQQNYQSALEGQKAQKNRALSDTKTVVAELEKQIEQAKQYGAELDAQIARIIASQRRRFAPRDRGTSPVGLAWPTDGIITQRFADPWNFDPSRIHGGLDIANAQGTPIYASASGVAETLAQLCPDGSYCGYGNYVVVYHNARFTTLYGHLSSFAITSGQDVTPGQVIGYMGSTGWSTGPHVHFEVWENGVRVDPEAYLP